MCDQFDQVKQGYHESNDTPLYVEKDFATHGAVKDGVSNHTVHANVVVLLPAETQKQEVVRKARSAFRDHERPSVSRTTPTATSEGRVGPSAVGRGSSQCRLRIIYIRTRFRYVLTDGVESVSLSWMAVSLS